jgi:hypothetical protein
LYEVVSEDVRNSCESAVRRDIENKSDPRKEEELKNERKGIR